MDNPDMPPIWVDALIDDLGNIIGRQALFGAEGWFTERDTLFCPFIIDVAGKIDFGSGYDEPSGERYAEFNIRDGPVEVGRLLSLDSQNYGRCRYRITEITQLPT